jgi:hypothetical protein
MQKYAFYFNPQSKSVFLWHFNRCFCGISIGVFVVKAKGRAVKLCLSVMLCVMIFIRG